MNLAQGHMGAWKLQEENQTQRTRPMNDASLPVGHEKRSL